MNTQRARFDADLYTDAAIADRAIRDRGPAVWLDAHDVWAIGRFADVRATLLADVVLVSGRGVAMNDMVNGHKTRSRSAATATSIASSAPC